jgi:hypothetical protein
MAMICEKIKLLAILPPKTGTTSITDCLIRNFEGRYIPKDHIRDKFGEIIVDYRHSSIRQLRELKLVDDEIFNSYKIIMGVRNPYDLIVSEYLHRKKVYSFYLKDLKGNTSEKEIMKKSSLSKNRIENIKSSVLPFPKYVSKFYGCRPNIGYTEYFTDGMDCTFFKFESLNENFKKILISCGVVNPPTLKKLNASKKRKNYRQYYDNETREIVERAFSNYLKIHNYNF